MFAMLSTYFSYQDKDQPREGYSMPTTLAYYNALPSQVFPNHGDVPHRSFLSSSSQLKHEHFYYL